MDSDVVLRRLVAEGFTKLACTGKLVNSLVSSVQSSRILMAPYQVINGLLILLFNPVGPTEDPRLFQCLSLFFNAFAFSNPKNQLLLVRAFCETSCTIFGAPKESPLSAIDHQKYIDAMYNLTSPELFKVYGYVL